MDVPLNEQQLRHLTIVLDQVDVALLAVIDGSGGGDRGAARRFVRPERHDIPAAIAPRLLESALELRQRLDTTLVRLKVRRAPESARRRVVAYLTSALVLLDDCHARALAAYGDVDPALPGLLDPLLDVLAADVDGLRRLLVDRADPDRTD